MAADDKGNPPTAPRGPRLPRDLFDETRDLVAESRQVEFGALVVEAGDDFELQDFATAFTKAVTAKRLGPRTASPRWLLGVAAYRMGRLELAAPELAAYHRLTGREDLEYLRADCARAQGRSERAIEILNAVKLKELDEDTLIETLIVAAGALWDLGRYEQAVEILQRGPNPSETEERHLRLWYALAESLQGAGRIDEARQQWELIYATDPEFFDVADKRII